VNDSVVAPASAGQEGTIGLAAEPESTGVEPESTGVEPESAGPDPESFEADGESIVEASVGGCDVDVLLLSEQAGNRQAARLAATSHERSQTIEEKRLAPARRNEFEIR
jgi:hypothetical protein